MTLTHVCELIALDFNQRLATIQNFAERAHDHFEPIIADYWQRREAARRADFAPDEPPDDDMIDYNGAELEIAYQQYPIIEADELVGLFALVHIGSSVDSLLDDLLKDTGVKRPTKKGAKGARSVPTQKTMSALLALEKATSKDAPARSAELVRDIIQARNDFVHNRGYQRTASRYVRPGDGRIRFTRADLRDALKWLRRLSHFFAKECQPLSKRL